MKILCWNINKKNSIHLVSNIVKYETDVVCLQEIKLYSPLDRQMSELYIHKYYNTKNPDVIVYSNIEFEEINSFSKYDERYKILKYDDIELCFIHNPMDDQKLVEIMYSFLRYEECKSKIGIIGDLNFFDESIDSQSNFTYCGNWFYKKLIGLGYIDSFRYLYKNKIDYTWFSNKGNGQRIDISLLKNIELIDFFYSHLERKMKLSDHSLMILKI